MRFERLRDEVIKAERRVEARTLRARTSWRVLGNVWREAWTPSRILVAGVAGGLLLAFSRPLGRMGSLGGMPATRWIQLATSLSGLVTAVRARHAAESAETAATDAGQAADDAADTVDAATGAAPGASRDPGPGPIPAAPATPQQPAGSVSDARRRPEAPWGSEPRPAEAATEVSER